jgi:RNA polymerase-binding transcription factor DksA
MTRTFPAGGAVGLFPPHPKGNIRRRSPVQTSVGRDVTDGQYAELRRKLDARLHELEIEREARRPEATGRLDDRMWIAIDEMKVEALRTVRDALARRANGAHPSCAACGGDIPRARLTAHPLAVRCRGCEEAREIGAARAGGDEEPRARSSSWFEGILAAVWTAF